MRNSYHSPAFVRPPGLPPDFEKTKSCRAGRPYEVGQVDSPCFQAV